MPKIIPMRELKNSMVFIMLCNLLSMNKLLIDEHHIVTKIDS